jgi:hypothetical protein
MVEKERKLRVATKKMDTYAIEAFVEKICDDFGIFNSYYGNILFTVTEAVNFAASKEVGGPGHVDIQFISRADGLVFQVLLGDRFLEIAVLFSKNMDEVLEKEDITEEERNMVMIRMLSDEVQFDPDREMMELVFYISSINQHLTHERIKVLDEYFNKLHQPKTA